MDLLTQAALFLVPIIDLSISLLTSWEDRLFHKLKPRSPTCKPSDCPDQSSAILNRRVER